MHCERAKGIKGRLEFKDVSCVEDVSFHPETLGLVKSLLGTPEMTNSKQECQIPITF